MKMIKLHLQQETNYVQCRIKLGGIMYASASGKCICCKTIVLRVLENLHLLLLKFRDILL